MFTKIFLQRSVERALKTFAQSLLTILTADHVAGFFSASFTEAVLAALFATALSFLTSFASAGVGDSSSPSLIEGKVEEQVLAKIDAGEPVGDPAQVFEPVVESAPAKPAPKKRAPKKKVV